jgi:hypothetical protein
VEHRGLAQCPAVARHDDLDIARLEHVLEIQPGDTAPVDRVDVLAGKAHAEPPGGGFHLDDPDIRQQLRQLQRVEALHRRQAIVPVRQGQPVLIEHTQAWVLQIGLRLERE